MLLRYRYPDGRLQALAERFRMPLTTAARKWQGTGVLQVIPVQATYQMLHFWDNDGAFGLVCQPRGTQDTPRSPTR